MGFLSKIRNNMQNKVSKMPRSDMGFRDMGPGNMPKRPNILGRGSLRDSFLFGRKPGMISDMRFRGEMPRGGGFGNLGEAIRRMQEQGQFGVPRGSRDPSTLESMQRTPQPIPERMPTDPSSYYNPTIFGQPIPQGADFGNMPNFSQIDMSQLDLSGIPQSISQMNLPQMPEGLPSIEEIQGNQRMPEMDRGRMQPRQMMNYGGEMKGYAEGDEVMMMQENEMMAPNGGDIESMLSGMDSGEQEAMDELEQMAPEMEIIDQLVMMVAQMIQQGADEQQVISFLREQGLDDEDIGTVLQLVSEMAETEEVAAQNEIGSDLEQLG